jgi:fibronectin type 3 domain-containing protein
MDTTVINSVVYEYKIMAVDSSGLESKPINPVRIRATGNNVKKQPIEIKGTIDGNGRFIHISWDGTEISGTSKIALYRSVNNEPPVLYYILSYAEKSYNDRNVIIGNSYTYKLQEISIDGSRTVLSTGITIRF